MSESIVFAPDCPPVGSAAMQPAEAGPMRPADLVQQVALVQEVMKAVMRDGEHYGVVPGCGDKPTLLQPGAQKLAMVFRLAPKLDINEKELGGGHREYMTRCDLYSITTGKLVGSGVGSCSTMESKYRYRNVADYEVTDQDIPRDAKERKAEYRKQGFGMKKVDGQWLWVRYKDTGKVENPDIADVYNTVLKMSKKRAFVDAVLTTTAASDIFTQDIEDLPGAEAFASDVVQEPDTAGADDLKSIETLREALGIKPAEFKKRLRAAFGKESLDALTRQEALNLKVTLRKKLADEHAPAETLDGRVIGEEPNDLDMGEEEIPF